MEYDVIVSLTTWKGRINNPKFPKVLFRLLKQQDTSFKYKVVLTLSREEFGEHYMLPETIELFTLDPNFEILWTDKNTKALKKLDPAMAKYPDAPIITLDDDDFIARWAIDAMMQAHKEHPKAILGTMCGAAFPPVIRVAGLRLFPPNSLANLPDEYFASYFDNLLDDEWNGIRAMVKGTESLKVVAKGIIENTAYFGRECALFKTYRMFKFIPAYNKFKKEHPEFNLK